MDIIPVTRDEIDHFGHPHPLSIVYLQQPNQKDENSEDEDEDKEKDEDDFVEEDHHGGQCNLCEERIWSFHLCYYQCKSCDYSLHKFCAELPETLVNHPSHPNHNLFLGRFYTRRVNCHVCNTELKGNRFYYCSVCFICMDITCATMSKQKINHPSHPHLLERMPGSIVSSCSACGNKHEGVFFLCTTCPGFRINQDCALLPAKLLIQNHTDGTFTHSHPLTLAYSFSSFDQRSAFYPICRACSQHFKYHLWAYKCDKCRYYVHVDCATSKKEPFMSIFQHESLGETSKNFKDDEHPNLLHCPFNDEGDNLLKRHMSNQKELIDKQNDGDTLNHFSHQHPLILFDKQTPVGITLHDPMKRVRLLCDGCVKPIITVPFYMCSEYVDGKCCFVLHEWCAKLPSEVQDYVGHPEHTLFLLPKISDRFFGVFKCTVCRLRSNGFAYGCTMCDFYVDINCAFIPEEITHEAHPDHLLLRVKTSPSNEMRLSCKACDDHSSPRWGFQCPSCNFYIHVECALLLPKVIKHKCDKHPLSLRYHPAENHISDYFCEICEFLNIKFGGMLEIKGHSHRLAFAQGFESDGKCVKCHRQLEFNMIFKCLECEYYPLRYGIMFCLMDIHFVREKVAKGEVRVLHVPSRYQIADIFIKGLPKVLFDDFRTSLNIRDPPVSIAGEY
ncbi:putative chromatin regulator PHD family [Helianthus annuus]|nr:putative chromatin regulator PHD family [Helianthus annuus]